MIPSFTRRGPNGRRPETEPADAAAGSANAGTESGAAVGAAPWLPATRRSPSPGPSAIVAAACGLAFAALTAWIAHRGSAVPGADQRIHAGVLAHRGVGTIRLARDLRWGGMTEITLPALVLAGAVAAGRGRGSGFYRRIGSGVALALSAAAGDLTETWINHLIGRARPPVADWAGAAGGPSFPSGHATAATLFALAAGWALASRVPAGWPRRAVWAGAAAYAAAVGWSRVWLGVHWPADVIGGWLFGIAWITGSIAVIHALRQRPASRRPSAS